jgi:hypothetical protein
MPPTNDDRDSPTVPDWAHFIAQDADGTWWAYEAEPNQHDHGWYENEVGRSARLHRDTPNPKWSQTLQRLDRAGRAS